MRTFFECIPCFFRQALDAARMASDDPAVHERVLRAVAQAVATMDLRDVPPKMGQLIHREVRAAGGGVDPYAAAKEHFNAFALGLLPGLRETIRTAADPFEVAVRLAAAGNIIDFAGGRSVSEEDVERSIDEALSGAIDSRALGELREALSRASTIFYIADNAGEIVFDRAFIELLGPERVTLGVRGTPVINDATEHDAREVGLLDLVPVIGNGSDAPGTILEECSREFLRVFENADVVLAKGQGNYETLSDAPREVFMLFKVKCPVVAEDAGEEMDAIVVVQGGTVRPRESFVSRA
ncbi:ARMT1-like domain-containing protein [bacterium]|nr:ARMT1-like domain-containing protein [bacterium]